VRSTAVRLSMTLPRGFAIRWPALCSVCGDPHIAGEASVLKQTPPLPFCPTCLSIHRRWSNWIRYWLIFALLFNAGPLLYLGASLDRPAPSQGSHYNLAPMFMAFAFFLLLLSAIAAAIGYTRRSELQGVQLQEIQMEESDDLHAPLRALDGIIELRFKNRDFYSAAVEANRTGEG